MDTSALICAAFLSGYSGPLPEPWYQDRIPTTWECEQAVDAETAQRHGCAALTGGVRGYVITIMPHNAPMRVQVVEAIRAIELERRGHLTSAQVYALANRSAECPARP